MKLIVFDFDKTLTVTDTLLPMSLYLSTRLRKRFSFFKVLISFLLFRLNMKSEYDFKKCIINVLIKGKNLEETENLIEEFYKINYDKLFLNRMIEIISDESESGNEILIISSNLNIFLKPLKKMFPVNNIESTNTEVIKDKYTGELIGNICSGEEKVKRILKYKSEKNYSEIIAYGDSSSDYPMLANANKSFLIRIRYNSITGRMIAKLKSLFGAIPSGSTGVEIINFTSYQM